MHFLGPKMLDFFSRKKEAGVWMNVGFLFSFLSKFWAIVKLHLITLSRVLHSRNIQFPMEGEREVQKYPEVSESFVRKKRGGRNGCWFAVQSRKWPFWKDQSRDKQEVIWKEIKCVLDTNFEQISIKSEQRQLLRCVLHDIIFTVTVWENEKGNSLKMDRLQIN